MMNASEQQAIGAAERRGAREKYARSWITRTPLTCHADKVRSRACRHSDFTVNVTGAKSVGSAQASRHLR
eukprot:6226066-Prymnesium_polylepis.3